jgi:hypothetical protein
MRDLLDPRPGFVVGLQNHMACSGLVAQLRARALRGEGLEDALQGEYDRVNMGGGFDPLRAAS